MSDAPTGQALEKASARTPDVIRTPDEYRGALLRWQEQNFHLLTPFANISGLPEQHGIVTTLIKVNPEPDQREVYAGLPFLQRDEVALAKNGLRKIAEGLGLNITLEYLTIDEDTFFWHVKAIATYKGIDGSEQRREASQPWNLRDGSPRLKGWQPKQIEEARKFGLRNCETRAINAVIRECGAGVKQAYKKADLAKPFVTVRVAFIPDMSDPEIKRVVAARAIGGAAALYPAPPAPRTAAAFRDDEEPEPRHIGSGSTTTSASVSAPSQTSTPAGDDRPPVEGAVRIEKVEDVPWEKNGKKGMRYVIVDSNGESCSTFDKSMADTARLYVTSRKWAELTIETQGQYRNLMDIMPAGAQPSLPALDNL